MNTMIISHNSGAFFFAYRKEETLFLPNLCMPKMLSFFFFWRIQICVRNMTKIFTPLSTLARPGSVTCHSSLGGGGGGAMSATAVCAP